MSAKSLCLKSIGFCLGLGATTACSPEANISIPEALPLAAEAEPETPRDTRDSIADNSQGDSETVPTPEETPIETPASGGETPLPPETKPTPDPVVVPDPVPVPDPTPTPDPVTPPPEVRGPIADGTYFIQGVQSKRCIDVPEGASTNGLQMQLYDCIANNPHQAFTIQWATGKGAYRIKTASGKSLAVTKDNVAINNPLTQVDAIDAPHTLWVIRKSGANNYFIQILGKNLVIDVINRQVGNNKPIEIYPPWNPAEPHQQWVFINPSL